jgi:MraZ protein
MPARRTRWNTTGTLDDKGRLSLPAEFRRRLEVERVSHLVAFFHLGSVWLLEEPLFDKLFESPVLDLDPARPKVLTYSRAVLSTAEDVEVDKTGRVRLSPRLRALAGLERELELFTIGDRVEVWAPERWAVAFAKELAAYEADPGVPLGILAPEAAPTAVSVP